MTLSLNSFNYSFNRCLLCIEYDVRWRILYRSLELDVKSPAFKLSLLLLRNFDVGDKICKVNTIIYVISVSYIFDMVNVNDKNLTGYLDPSRCSNIIV